jgi:hypothetical protein
MQNRIIIKLDSSLAAFIDSLRGPLSRERFIEQSLKKVSDIFEAVWFLSSEIHSLKAGKKSSGKAIPKGLKHYGLVEVQLKTLDFYSRDFELLFSIDFDSIKNMSIKADHSFEKLIRLKHVNPPLHFDFDHDRIYLFTRGFDEIRFKGDNKRFISLLKNNI